MRCSCEETYSPFCLPTTPVVQAVAAAGIKGKPSIFLAAESGDIQLVSDYVIADPASLCEEDSD